VRPGRDEKVLVSWNALMIAGMARAAVVFGRGVAAFGQERLFLHTRHDVEGRAPPRHLQDSAPISTPTWMTTLSCCSRRSSCFRPSSSRALAFAGELAEVLLEQFEDRENGGFFFTSHDHERLIHRPKPGYDNATPSGNGMAALALQRLHFLTGESRYALAAERTLAQFHSVMAEQPGGHATLLAALEEHLTPTRTIILRGPSEELQRGGPRLPPSAAQRWLAIETSSESAAGARQAFGRRVKAGVRHELSCACRAP
jgi:uncharacterized protein YyaL (SSP411 family)